MENEKRGTGGSRPFDVRTPSGGEKQEQSEKAGVCQMSGALSDLREWPPGTKDVVDTCARMFLRGYRHRPASLDEVRPLMLRGNVKPGDAEIIRFVAELAVTPPPLLAACPEFRDVPSMRAAMSAIKVLAEAGLSGSKR